MGGYKQFWPLFLMLAIGIGAGALNKFGPQPDPSTATRNSPTYHWTDTATPGAVDQQKIFDNCNAKNFKGCY